MRRMGPTIGCPVTRPVASLQVTEGHLLWTGGQVTPHGQIFCMCVVSDGGALTFDGGIAPVPHAGYGPASNLSKH